MYMFDCPKNSQTVNGRDFKFAYVMINAIPRSTVLFSTFQFSNFHHFLSGIRALNPIASEME